MSALPPRVQITAPRRRLRSADISQATYSPGLRMGLHGHERAYFSLVMCGGYEERIGSLPREIAIPSVIFHPTEEDHSVQFGAVNTSILRIDLNNVAIELARESGVCITESLDITTHESMWLAARIQAEYLSPDPVSALALEALTLDLLTHVGRAPRRMQGENKIGIARDYLVAHFRDELCLVDIARHVGIHPVSLARGFRRTYGCTVGQYVRELRLKAATDLLLSSDWTIAQIAADCGFADQAHFARRFKVRTLLTPSEYRKSYLTG